MVFSINDTSVGSGPDALPSKTLFNLATGESFQIVHSWGGKTESLRLSPATGKLRDVLQTHDGNATALRLGPHYAGAFYSHSRTVFGTARTPSTARRTTCRARSACRAARAATRCTASCTTARSR